MSRHEEFGISGIYDRSFKYILTVSLILFCLFYENISYALGFVLGGLACLLNFRLMIKSSEDMLYKRSYSKTFFNCFFLLRLSLVIAVMIGGIIMESVNLFTAVAGILTIRLVITWEAVTKKNSRQKSME